MSIPDTKVDFAVEIAAFEERQNKCLSRPRLRICGVVNAIRRKTAVRVEIVVQGQPELFEIILALSSPSGFTGRLNSWKQQGDEHRDDGNHDQQLNQGEPASAG